MITLAVAMYGGQYRVRFARLIALVIIIMSAVLSSPTAYSQGTGYCLDSEFPFETSALEKIIRDPQGVLEDEDRFWETETAQVYTTKWYRSVQANISRDTWRKEVKKLAEKTRDERESLPLAQMTESIIDGKSEFMARAIPHICTYLPENTDLNMPVYFTAFISPRSLVGEGIVINISDAYWKGNAQYVFNGLVREIFHEAGLRLKPSRTERPLENWQLYEMLESLQSEGMATFVGYRAVPIFPAGGEIDYQMLEKPEEVMRALVAVNEIFDKTGAVAEDELQILSWRKGFIDRAYYIAGAHMAEVIDRQVGTEALIRTITQGPLSFVETYNSRVPENMRIVFPDDETIQARLQSGGDSGFHYILLFVALVFLAMGVFVWRLSRRQQTAGQQAAEQPPTES